MRHRFGISIKSISIQSLHLRLVRPYGTTRKNNIYIIIYTGTKEFLVVNDTHFYIIRATLFFTLICRTGKYTVFKNIPRVVEYDSGESVITSVVVKKNSNNKQRRTTLLSV